MCKFYVQLDGYPATGWKILMKGVPRSRKQRSNVNSSIKCVSDGRCVLRISHWDFRLGEAYIKVTNLSWHYIQILANCACTIIEINPKENNYTLNDMNVFAQWKILNYMNCVSNNIFQIQTFYSISCFTLLLGRIIISVHSGVHGIWPHLASVIYNNIVY